MTFWMATAFVRRWLYFSRFPARLGEPEGAAILRRRTVIVRTVVRLDLVCARRDLLSQLRAAQILQKKRRPNDAAELAEGLVEAIPPAVGTQSAKQERRRDGSCFDR